MVEHQRQDHLGRCLEGIKVLVVDDEDDARSMLRRMLTRHGADVISVSSVEDAVLALGTFTPHVIVSDIMMPGRDGYALIREVREAAERAGRRRIPAIAVTGLASIDDYDRSVYEGYQAHISKPITSSFLVAAIVSLTAAGEGAVSPSELR